MSKIILNVSLEDDAKMFPLGAVFDRQIRKWTIDESQKSDPNFAKYLPVENITMNDFEPSQDWAGDTEKQIFGQMNSQSPKPSNQIKTNTTPEAKKEEIAPTTSSPRKRKPRKPIKLSDKSMTETRTFLMKPDRINDLKDLSKYYQLNLSMTIDKAIDFLLKHVQDQNKGDLSKLYKDNNSLLPRLANEIVKLQNLITIQHEFIDFIGRRENHERKNDPQSPTVQNFNDYLKKWKEAQNVSNDER